MLETQRVDGRVDYLEKFARQMPLIVIGELLGLPEEDQIKLRPRESRDGLISDLM